jgi:hypothetical protein
MGSYPSLVIADPDIIKNLLVKEFSKAPNRYVSRRGLIQVLVGCLLAVLRPAQGYFTYMETSTLPVKGCKI